MGPTAPSHSHAVERRVALPPNVSVFAHGPPAADLDAVVELTGDISEWTGLVTSEDEYDQIAML